MEAFGKKGRREAGGAAADNRDITFTREGKRQESSVRVLRRRLCRLGNRPARVAADDGFVCFGLADDFGPMAAALRTDGRRLGPFYRVESVLEMNHSVI